jgi:hypothetical protein
VCVCTPPPTHTHAHTHTHTHTHRTSPHCRHGQDDYGTPKTSLSSTDLRNLWQGGVDLMFKAIALSLMPVIYLAIALATRFVISRIKGTPHKARKSHRHTKSGATRGSIVNRDSPIIFRREPDATPLSPDGSHRDQYHSTHDAAPAATTTRTAQSLPATFASGDATAGSSAAQGTVDDSDLNSAHVSSRDGAVSIV